MLKIIKQHEPSATVTSPERDLQEETTEVEQREEQGEPGGDESVRSDGEGTNIFECADCEVITTSAKTYFWHLKEEHGADFNVFECNECDFATRDRQLLAEHSLNHSQVNEEMSATLEEQEEEDGDDNDEDDEDEDDEEEEDLSIAQTTGDDQLIKPEAADVLSYQQQASKSMLNQEKLFSSINLDSSPNSSTTSIIGNMIKSIKSVPFNIGDIDAKPKEEEAHISKSAFMGKMGLGMGAMGSQPVFPGSKSEEEETKLMIDEGMRQIRTSTPVVRPQPTGQQSLLKVNHALLAKQQNRFATTTGRPVTMATGTIGSKPKSGCAPVREAVDPAKYVTIQEADGVKYACSKCGNIYKWRKSLNKHWKEKHDGEIPDPRPNFTALNIPRLKSSLTTPTAVSVLKDPNGNLEILNDQRIVSRSTSGHMSGGEVKMETISYRSPAIRRALKRPTSGMESGTTSSYASDFGVSVKGTSVSSSNGRSLLKFPPQAAQMSPMVFHGSSPEKSITYITPSDGNSLGKYGTTTIITKKPSMIMVDSQGKQSVLESPIDLTKQISQPPAYHHMKSDTGALDLSQKSVQSIMSPASHSIQAVSTEVEPPQDEPLDFSIKSSSKDKMETYSDSVPEQIGSLNLQCPSCAYTARNKQDYDKHLELHLRKRHHKCAECQEVFFTVTELNYHFSSEHSDILQQQMLAIASGDGAGSLTQRPQQGKTQESTQLFKYLTMNSPEQLLSCLVCGTIFQWQWTLSKHFEEAHGMLPNPYKKAAIAAGSPSYSDDIDEEPPKLHRYDAYKTNSLNPLQCKFCTFVAGCSQELTQHQLRHSIGRQYACGACPFTTRWKDQLQNHYKQVHPAASLEGRVAASPTVTERELPQHNQIVTSNGSLVEISTEEGTAIVIPTAPEETEPELSGSDREGESPSKKSRMKAMAGMNNNAEALLPFKCSVCEYRARWPSEITQHMKNHSDEKPFLCPRCSYRSKWKWDVVKHLKRCGGGTVKDVIDTTKARKQQQVKALLADVPPSTKSSKSSTVLHSPTAGRELLSNGPPNVTVVPSAGGGYSQVENPSPLERSYASGCEDLRNESAQLSDCSDSYSPTGASMSGSGDDLSQSLLSQGQHFCLHCPFVGNSPAELKRHSRVHSDEKPFICKTCGYCSKWKCDLKKHLRTYNHTSAVPLTYGGHGRKPADWKDEQNGTEPSVCDEASAGQENLDTEWGKTTSSSRLPTLYKCEKCQYVTYKKNQLDSHMKIHRDSSVSSGQAGKLKCKTCDFTASDLSSFLQHKLTHSTQQGGDATVAMATNANSSEQLPSDSTGNSSVGQSQDSGEPATAPSGKHRRKPIRGHRIVNNPITTDTEPFEPVYGMEDLEDMGEKSNNSLALDFTKKDLPVGTVAPMIQASSKISRLPGSQKTPHYKCSHCPYMTDNKFNYEKHTRFHTTPNKYTCEWCNWSIDRLNLLYRHAQIVHPEELALQEKETFFGKVRGRTGSSGFVGTADPEGLEDSLEQEDPEEVIDPDVLSVRRRLSLGNGKRTREEGGEEQEKTKRRRRLKTCPECGYITDNVTTLQRHMAKHGSGGKYQCNFCNYAVDRLHIVEYHMKIVHLKEQSTIKMEERKMSTDEEPSLPATPQEDPVEEEVPEENTPEVPEENTPEEMSVDGMEESNTEDKEGVEGEEEEVVETEMVPDGEIVEEEVEDESGKPKRVLWEITRIKGQRMKVQRIGNKTTYHCLQCPFINKNITNSANHMKQHGAKKKYVCEFCDYSLDQLRHIITHMKNVHGTKGSYEGMDTSCDTGDDCGLPGDQEGNDSLDSDAVEEQWNEADKVRKAVSPRGSTGSADSGEGPRKSPGSPKSNGHTRHRCSICPFVTQTPASLKRHMDGHKRFGAKLQCDECDYKATTGRLLQQHVKAQHGSAKQA